VPSCNCYKHHEPSTKDPITKARLLVPGSATDVGTDLNDAQQLKA